MTGSPSVSVVTPVFNTAEYLEECIQSVLRQTYSDFEYVIVDNHSTDGSGAIAGRYAQADRRVRVISPPEFLGQVANYNFALTQISPASEFCKLVQADDWIMPQCLEEMCTLAAQHDRVAMVGAYRLIGAFPGGFGVPVDHAVLSGREACRMHLLDRVYPFGSPTSVLYRSDLVRGRQPFFPTGVLYDDTELAFDLLRDHDFGFVHQVLTYSRRQPDSVIADAYARNGEALDHLLMAEKFGAHYLSATEHRDLVRRELWAVYRGIARRWVLDRVHGPDDGFWEYQERALSEVGRTLDRALLARAVAALLAEQATPTAARSKVAERLSTLLGPGTRQLG